MTFREFTNIKKNPWVAKKADILKTWRAMRPDAPLRPAPVPEGHKGNRFDQDGVRITGSSEFINSVLGKIKEFLPYADNPYLDLDVKYRQILKRDLADRQSFACYINVVQKKKNA